MKKVMVVTGGSRGIGAATARLAAKQGYTICINYLHNQEAANKTLEDLKQLGSTAISVAGDVASESDVINLFNTVDEQLGKVTALVNNAGILDRIERIKEFIPMKRGGRAIEVARAILWLLSNEASYTTGSFIDVMGGK